MVSSSLERAEQTVYKGGSASSGWSAKGFIPDSWRDASMFVFVALASSSESRSALEISGMTFVKVDRRFKISRSKSVGSVRKLARIQGFLYPSNLRRCIR